MAHPGRLPTKESKGPVGREAWNYMVPTPAMFPIGSQKAPSKKGRRQWAGTWVPLALVSQIRAVHLQGDADWAVVLVASRVQGGDWAQSSCKLSCSVDHPWSIEAVYPFLGCLCGS
ncbi:hypothetical protein KIL84_016247 [Mauremys mutica]|uniref:Uncharacterized protein n=1 Tax=Mauremys mutica TaxID=74926 RepID=A0A9D3WU33_9SAUR|nr:hypothetical protein KIL84_016247 [Mauremys mutica]